MTVREQRTEPAVRLSSQQVASLQASSAVSLSPTLGQTDTWDIRTSQYVGVVHAPDLQLRISPKVPVRNLLFLLGYASKQSGWHDVPLDVEEERDLVPALAGALVHFADQALARGVLQGYRREEDALLTLRGRLREGDQLRRRFGFPIPVEVAWDEYSVDIPENQLLATAATLLLRLGQLPDRTRRRLLHLLHRLEGVSLLAGGRQLPAIRFSRLNRHYAQAIGVADLVLSHRSTNLGTGARAGLSFLFDMNRVFEDFLTATLSPAIERFGGSVVAQHRDSLDDAGAIEIKPDLTWWSGGACGAVVDAKYKSLATADLPNADVYQMLAYCTALGVPTGWLVYAAGNEEPAVHSVRGTAVCVRVATIDLSHRPPEVVAAVDELARSIVGVTQARGVAETA